MLRILAFSLALALPACLLANPATDPKRQYSTALLAAISTVQDGQMEEATSANQQLHQAAMCLFLISKSPLQTMANINQRLINSNQELKDLRRLPSLSDKVSPRTYRDQTSPCTAFTEDAA